MPRGHRKTDALAPKPDKAALALKTRETLERILRPTVEAESQWRILADQIAAQHDASCSDVVPPARRGYLSQPHTIAGLLHLVSEGCSPTQACHRCGINHANLSHWTDKAKHEPDGPHAAMMAGLKAAVETWGHRLTQRIEKASEKEQHWTAAAWLKERSPQFNGDYKLAEAQRNQGVTIIIGVQGERVTVGESPDPAPSVSHPTNLPIIDIPSKS